MVVLNGLISPGDEILRMGAIKTRLNLKYDTLISVIPVSDTDYQQGTTPLLKNVRAEGIPLQSGSPMTRIYNSPHHKQKLS